MPAMLLRDGRPSVVLGTMGGKGQPQILAHVLLHLARGAGAQEALDAPRWLVGGMGADAAVDEVRMERDVPAAAQRALLDSGIPVRELPAHDQGTGHAQLVAIGPDRALEAASDPRSEGRAATA
jgi:gamma-glutamyltranspeptidase/glutathione hydrolase